ncbi:hypothetical protein J2129_000134 [Methanofollis sp. W23]|uniref:hypothetical protein n=1 Tax=Methanofollis sp. W23 TaxID=2817849 RepID=UPI001AE2CBA1|nr:hypothetical protein [Methanofollis sp. W23]MBP2144680.1 hypothetical protein [Methanofollis sp. W23]
MPGFVEPLWMEIFCEGRGVTRRDGSLEEFYKADIVALQNPSPIVERGCVTRLPIVKKVEHVIVLSSLSGRFLLALDRERYSHARSGHARHQDRTRDGTPLLGRHLLIMDAS